WYDAVINHKGPPPGPLGIPLGSLLSGGTPPKIVKKDGIIILFDRNGLGGVGASVPAIGGLLRLPVAAWQVQGALPERLTGPTLNAKANEIAIETLELSHEGISRISIASIVSAAAGAIGGALGL